MHFKACKHIFHSINLVPKGLLFCCRESRDIVPEMKINSILDIDYFAEFKNNKIKKMQQGIFDECINCKHLCDNEWPDDDKIKRVFINNFRKCNCRCYYCKVYNTGESEYDALSIIKRLEHNNLISEKIDHVAFGGGEVSINKKIELAILHFIKNNIQMTVHTNAIIFSETIACLLDAGGTVAISPDSGSRQTYFKIKGVDKFDDVRCNILRYAKHGKVRLKYIINEFNCKKNDLDGYTGIIKQSKNIIPYISFTSEACKHGDYPAYQLKFVCNMIDEFEENAIKWNYFSPFVWPDTVSTINGYKNTVHQTMKAPLNYSRCATKLPRQKDVSGAKFALPITEIRNER